MHPERLVEMVQQASELSREMIPWAAALAVFSADKVSKLESRAGRSLFIITAGLSIASVMFGAVCISRLIAFSAEESNKGLPSDIQQLAIIQIATLLIAIFPAVAALLSFKREDKPFRCNYSQPVLWSADNSPFDGRSHTEINTGPS